MSRFNLDDYEPVEDRLQRFWSDHPDGRMLTELIRAEGDLVIFRAEAYRDSESERPSATGYAHEVTGSSPVNKTSALENCETSAVGRALANLGYAPKGARPSREEMTKAKPPAPAEAPDGSAPKGKDASPPVASANKREQLLIDLRAKWYAAGRELLTDQELQTYIQGKWKCSRSRDMSRTQLEQDIAAFIKAKGDENGAAQFKSLAGASA